MKPKRTQAELDEERIARQHKKAVLGSARRFATGELKGHIAYKARFLQRPLDESLDEYEESD